MAPSILGSVSFLVLLCLETASADYSCYLASSPPIDSVCGTLGEPTNFVYNDLEHLGDPRYLTPEGCAAGCAANPSCLSFELNAYSAHLCDLLPKNSTQLGFTADPSSIFQQYDLTCFICSTVPPTSTATSSSPTPFPTACSKKHPSPKNAICGTTAFAYLSDNILNTTYEGDPVSSVTKCALNCAESDGCGGFFFSPAPHTDAKC